MSAALLFALAAGLPRVVSADFCADQYVLALADPAQIAALSPDAGADFSYLRARAADHPSRRPDAEEIVRARPDVVLRFWGGDAARLERLGVSVVTLPYASDFADVEAVIGAAAAALGQPAAGAAMVDDLRARIARLRTQRGEPRRTLYTTPGGVTAAGGTMVDAILEAAGVVNIAAADGATGWPSLPAETLIATPPDLIVTGFFSMKSETVNWWSSVRHPALARLFAATPTVHLSPAVVACPGWFGLDAAEAIARAAPRAPARIAPRALE